MPDVEYHGWTHRPKELGGTDPIESAGPAPWCRLGMADDQTVGTPPNSPIIEFDPGETTNDYPDTFTVIDPGDSTTGQMQVQLNEDGIYHAIVYIEVTANPTNGYELCFVGGQMDQTSENWNVYIDPRGTLYRYAEFTFRRGASTAWIYAFVRTISGNGTWVIEADSTFLEIHKLASATS